ncbi:hypothetical protein [Teredinibacter turnerae]|uniref:hypothetical protein n=1 Tax=Teredinibacter turnerae TaxID=2426 RepID=UPI0012F897CB|nr:hypothetical protein [Teredinibacter turnerae]
MASESGAYRIGYKGKTIGEVVEPLVDFSVMAQGKKIIDTDHEISEGNYAVSVDSVIAPGVTVTVKENAVWRVL